ncbi:MAG: nitroreductase [Lachnospiraceae bacterium]|nr:nitroreductase [Lachnospiraceae bacterium]
MSEVLNKMQTRRSIRKFKSDMVPREVLEKIIDAGTYAASGMNKQAGIIVAVTNKEVRDKLSKANARVMGNEATDPFYGAPVVLVVLASKEAGTYVYDGSLVMGNLMLAAHELGIGSCWIHRAKEVFEQPEWQEWLKSLGIEGDYEGVGNCVLGYVDGDYPAVPPRKENRVFYVE